MNKKINFAWPVTILGRYDYDALKKFVDENHEILQKKKIIIFGAGIRGTLFSVLLKKFGYLDIVFTDNNSKKVGGCINEHPIISYADSLKMKDQAVIIISVENGFKIKNQLDRDGLIENKDYYYIENRIYERYLSEFKNVTKIENLIMGDCGLADVSIKDTNYDNLGEILKERLGEDKTKVLAVHGMGMRAFYHILKAHIDKISIPKRAVIMANFETFTGMQHLLPRSQHHNLIEMINKAINEEDEELKEYSRITKERFENFKIDFFTSSNDVLENMNQDKNDRIVIRMNYMYKLNLENECVQYLFKIISLAKSHNIQLLFFIPPANYEYAEELYGKKFYDAYSYNCDKLKQAISEKGGKVLDLSYALKKSEFADIHTIDETANYNGRLIVANKIVEVLREGIE